MLPPVGVCMLAGTREMCSPSLEYCMQGIQHRADADVIMAALERTATKECMALLEDPKAASNLINVPAVALLTRRKDRSGSP